MELDDPRHGDGPGAAALTWGRAELGGHLTIVCRWDFSVAGGSFGERDATGFCDAAAAAVHHRLPLVCLTASGGTRLTEGVPALVGMARVTLARRLLADAGLPLVAVCQGPTTGGVWVTVVSGADLRCAVEGTTLGFAGPRVVEAVTGSLPTGSHTAGTALAHGLVDAVVPAGGVDPWLARVLSCLAAAGSPSNDPVVRVEPSPLTGWEAVTATRTSSRPAGGALLDGLVGGPVPLAAADPSVAALLGQVGGRGVVAVALAAERRGAPSVAGMRLLTRAARLAGRTGLPLLTLVDTPGADPTASAENAGIAAAIAEAFDAVLTCPSPTLGVLTGEGGSGAALAALVCDGVLACRDSYFAALVPEGAAAALRTTPEVAAAQLRLAPGELTGVIDALLPSAGSPGFAAGVQAGLARVTAAPERLARRQDRWSAPAPR